jgi:hypothetical protein
MERLPANIEAEMAQWRQGVGAFPPSYAEWHRQQAERAIVKLDAQYIIHRKLWVDDGWLDGMKFVAVIVEDRYSGQLFKLKWSDSQRWYRQSPAGGWVLHDQSVTTAVQRWAEEVNLALPGKLFGNVI